MGPSGDPAIAPLVHRIIGSLGGLRWVTVSWGYRPRTLQVLVRVDFKLPPVSSFRIHNYRYPTNSFIISNIQTSFRISHKSFIFNNSLGSLFRPCVFNNLLGGSPSPLISLTWGQPSFFEPLLACGLSAIEATVRGVKNVAGHAGGHHGTK
jgi:hypothetical protein